MSDNVGPRTFSQVFAQHDPSRNLFESVSKAEHLRGDDTGTRLYTHSAFSFSGRSDASKIARDLKWAQGSAIVRQSITEEYGHGVGEAVFQKITAETGRDLRQAVLRGDLPRIRTAINEVKPGSIPGLDGPSTPYKGTPNDNQVGQKAVFGTSGSEVRGSVERTGPTDRRLTEMFGHRLTDADIRGLGGVPERCNVELELVALHPGLHRNIGPDASGVMISKKDADPSGVFKTIQMTVYKDQAGNLNIYRDKTTTHTDDTVGEDETLRPTNLGACALVKQVDTARALGVSTIHNLSSQGKGYNGYYTWARYGGNASLAPKDINVLENDTAIPQPGKTNVRDQDAPRYQKFREALASSTVPAIQQLHKRPDLDVQDFMQTQEGRDFWRANGFAIPLDFSLQTGSKTMRTMVEHTVPNSCFNLR